MVMQGFFRNKEIAFKLGDCFNVNGVIVIRNARKIGNWGHNHAPNKIKLNEIELSNDTKAKILSEVAFAAPTKNKKNNSPQKKLRRPQLQH